MCYCHQCSLHHICVSWANNDNIHQGLEPIFGDKDIHLSLGMTREKVGNLPLNMCSLSKMIVVTIFQNVLWAIG
jgi:hypothetical protein